MIYLNSFLFAGAVCLLGQIILDNTKLTAGHITSIFVCLGAFLDIFNIYDKIVTVVPITSFGHLLIHGALAQAEQYGFIGLLTGMFNLTASGITAAIIFTFIFSLFFKPKD